MNPLKLLASRNLLIGIALLAVLFVALVLLQTRLGSSESIPSAARIGTPPTAKGEVVPVDTILTAYARSRTAALRRYREAPFTVQVDAVMPVGKNGWSTAVTLNGGRATAYFADSQWRAIAPPIEAGQTRTLTCADWEAGASGTVAMYGCGVVAD